MQRLSYQTFSQKDWGENVYALRIQKGKFYALAFVEEWESAHEHLSETDTEYYHILAARNTDGLFLFKDNIMLCTLSDAIMMSPDYERPMSLVFHYEGDASGLKERKKYHSVYECLTQFIRPYTQKHSTTDENDYEILVMTTEEFQNICDSLRDGDYIIIIKEEF